MQLGKTCPKCKIEKDIEEFHKNKLRYDGRAFMCKFCKKHESAQRWINNKDSIARTNKEWASKNRPKCRARSQRYYKRNTDKELSRSKRYLIGYRAKHRDELARKNRERYRTDSNFRMIIKIGNHLRRAKLQEANGNFTRKMWLQRVEYFGWKCRYCRCPLDQNTLVMEHQIPIARGGSNWLSNLVPACESCNRSKNCKTPKEFAEYKRIKEKYACNRGDGSMQIGEIDGSQIYREGGPQEGSDSRNI